MKEPRVPTLDEMLAELATPQPIKPGGRTVREWAVEWGTHEERARGVIREAVQAGRMETAQAQRPDILRPGRRVWVYLHSFKAKKK